MPVYVYRNLVTNETFEHQQSIKDDPLTVDPRTGDPVKRVIQPVGIAFKGSGFYVNDSRSSSGKASSSADAASSAGTGASSGSGASGGSDAGSSGAAKSGPGSSKGASTTPAATASSSD